MFNMDIEEIEEKFGIKLPSDMNLLFSIYDYHNYYGKYMGIYEESEELYEIHAEHCSCHGLKGKWNPEITTKEAIFYMADKGEGLYNEYKKEILEAVGIKLPPHIFSIIIEDELDDKGVDKLYELDFDSDYIFRDEKINKYIIWFNIDNGYYEHIVSKKLEEIKNSGYKAKIQDE